MAPTFGDRIQHAFNAFFNGDRSEQAPQQSWGMGESYSTHQGGRRSLQMSNERSIVASVYTRIGIDVASVDIRHVKLDDNDRYIETLKTGLNECLTVSANIDQASRAFMQDVAMSLFDKGVVAIVPVDTSINPLSSGSYDINSLRVGNIVAWYPRHVRVDLYNDRTGRREELTLAKDTIAIVENPLYAVMNEPNSTLQRLIRKLNLLDVVDDASSSGKLDLIIQLPYVIKSEARRNEAKRRANDIQEQLRENTHGIAYTDGTEKITQLNRPAENNLMGQIEMLTEMVYAQLGVGKAIFDGTADEAAMLNYHNRTVEPILAAITQAMKRVFLTKTARTQKQSILYFRDPFKLVAISSIADIADKFTRNEILSANDMRGIIGFKPSSDPKADELVNSNMPQPGVTVPLTT